MLKRFVAALAVALALGGGTAKAEEALVSFKVLSPAVALELAQATLEACRSAGYQVSVAVVDRLGIPQLILRDRHAGPPTPETARRQAWTTGELQPQLLIELISQCGDAGLRRRLGIVQFCRVGMIAAV